MKTIEYAVKWLICAAALAMVGCAPGADGLKQGIANTSRIVASGYRALGIYDVKRQNEIRINAKNDAKAAAAQELAYLKQFDAAKQVLDSAADTVDAAVKFETLYEQGLAKSKDASTWIANLAAAAVAVTGALHTMGVF